MPELVECLAHYLFLSKLYERHLGADWNLRNIWVDGTDKELLQAPEGSRLADGQVYILSRDSEIKRGCGGGQSPICPSSSVWPYPNFQGLTLQGISYTYRALILDLRPLWLQVQYLTHTSVQLFSSAQWYDSVTQVNRETRGFKIGLALEFGDFVLAFVTMDQLLQVTWANVREQLPKSPPAKTFYDRNAFLANVVSWRDRRRGDSRCNRNIFIFDVLRDNGDIFPGVGVYTASELLYLAGLCAFLTERDVFDVPSRAARLIEAYFSWIIRAQNGIYKLIKPCIHDGFLAPTNLQRMSYAHYLHVYGKMQAWMPVRLAISIDNRKAQMRVSKSRNDSKLLDCFEPTNIKLSLDKDPVSNLAHLIFGESDKGHNDALTKVYRTEGLLHSSTHLPSYNPRFLNEEEMTRAWRPTYMYRTKKMIWTVVPKGSRVHAIDLTCDRKQNTFKHKIFETCSVAVGLLEYCGNGRLIRTRHGSRVSICRADPKQHPFFMSREMKGINRRRVRADAKGKRKVALTASQKVPANNMSTTIEFSEAGDGRVQPEDDSVTDIRIQPEDNSITELESSEAGDARIQPEDDSVTEPESSEAGDARIQLDDDSVIEPESNTGNIGIQLGDEQEERQVKVRKEVDEVDEVSDDGNHDLSAHAAHDNPVHDPDEQDIPDPDLDLDEDPHACQSDDSFDVHAGQPDGGYADALAHDWPNVKPIPIQQMERKNALQKLGTTDLHKSLAKGFHEIAMIHEILADRAGPEDDCADSRGSKKAFLSFRNGSGPSPKQKAARFHPYK
ncbi:hypothetical protein NM688_g4485 [Phlebia brevispora]|uniref:Uncharacterized protein n=1 Tax=Phlebia brevispora TaxID=194682 RepID=A0ACC1T2H4_9APHY|nr:hypothetical protein NM688_g4485 [Phlebia brevispora]